MHTKKHIRPGEKLPIKLTAADCSASSPKSLGTDDAEGLMGFLTSRIAGGIR
ncbi:hypothetical protein ETAA8_45800 [Anatilimnocola aggregata]|uniref:Uncharacterized protein n=1 Tax=Anatilimnocola aggregata TaxID=2528021 RepID=A0A517YGV7_9BACT|nr:hypothetical protein [Anatilimnocola aggregata]QDU29470.1 hypothetical protein ETAA8_45800 [Anatilimnocola aggregata]